MLKNLFSKNVSVSNDIKVPDTSWAADRINQRIDDIGELSNLRESLSTDVPECDFIQVES